MQSLKVKLPFSYNNRHTIYVKCGENIRKQQYNNGSYSSSIVGIKQIELMNYHWGKRDKGYKGEN